jgi:hypothetical protein
LNCGRCIKCARTVLTLEHFGLLDRYAAQFNLAPLRTSRRNLIAHLYSHPELLNDEVLDLVDPPRGRLLRRMREQLRREIIRRRLGVLIGARTGHELRE